MTYALRGRGLAAALVLVSTLVVVPQGKAQSTAAYVYVQSQGQAGPVYGYSANSSGQLAAIPGSPFKPGTAIVGGNGTQFFTMGQTLLHSWALGSNGAIGLQLSQEPVFDYGGSSCGVSNSGENGAVLDHTGKYIYVLLQDGGDWSCSAYQTYKVNSDGSFTFVGDTEENWGDQSGQVNPSSLNLPSILGNESFAYTYQVDGHEANPIGLRRLSSGELQLIQIQETDPTGADNNNYVVESPDASPAGNYVVFQLYPDDSFPAQLGVYTVDSSGNLSTTNTSSNMPTSSLFITSMAFSPDGAMFAVAGDNGHGVGSGSGIEIYNFNGAAPLTLNTTLLNGTPIDQVAWDSTHHLYAISRAESKLWVFEVGSASTAQTAVVSSPSPLSMVVVRQASGPAACAPPSGNGVSVCSPSEGAMLNSPVEISAAATVSGGVYRFEVWNGSTKLISSDSGTISQSVTLAPGTYKLTFDAYNSAKTDHEYATRDITVSGTGNAVTQYQAPLIGQSTTPNGHVTIDTAGNTTAQVTGVAANTKYTLEFCAAVIALEYRPGPCFDISTLSTDSSGSGNSTARFPQSGDWAGDFSLIAPNGEWVMMTNLVPNVANETYFATLVPATKTNGGEVEPTTPTYTVQEPLTSGSVKFSGGIAVFTMNGASPNSTYDLVQTEGTDLDSSSSYGIGPSINTNSSGDGSSSVNLASQGTDGGDMFQVMYQATGSQNYQRAGFIGGFSIP